MIDLLQSTLHAKHTNTKENSKVRSRSEFYMMVNFVNKGIEMINLPRILHLKDVFQSLPFISNTKKKKVIPSVNYSYLPPIRSKILNYSKALKEFTIKDDVAFPPCNCETSEFKDLHHNHIITGDLKIVKNQRLRDLLSKGCGHREDNVVNWKKSEKGSL